MNGSIDKSRLKLRHAKLHTHTYNLSLSLSSLNTQLPCLVFSGRNFVKSLVFVSAPFYAAAADAIFSIIKIDKY